MRVLGSAFLAGALFIQEMNCCGRTFHRSVGTEDAAIARFSPENALAGFALVVDYTPIRRHRFSLRMLTLRTSDNRFHKFSLAIRKQYSTEALIFLYPAWYELIEQSEFGKLSYTFGEVG